MEHMGFTLLLENVSVKKGIAEDEFLDIIREAGMLNQLLGTSKEDTSTYDVAKFRSKITRLKGRVVSCVWSGDGNTRTGSTSSGGEGEHSSMRRPRHDLALGSESAAAP